MNKKNHRQPSQKLLPRLSKPPQLKLSPLEVELIQNVHRGCTEIILEKEFGGGFSHARVFLVVPIKPGGARAARLATKTGEAKDLRSERDKYQAHVAPDVPFSVAQVREYYEQDDQAALNYVFAGGQALGQTVSLKEYYRSHTAQEVINTLTGLLEKALGSMWYGQGHPHNCPFRAEYGRHLPDGLEKILKIVFPNLSLVEGGRVQIPGVGGTYPHPLNVYPSLLDKMLEGRRSIVHGDLHLLNILVDENGKGWLIDFAKVQERHNLFDFIKLETYVRLTALAAEQGAFSWGEYLQFEQALNAAALGQWAIAPANLTLTKAYEVIQAIRQIALNYLGYPHNFKNEYLPGLFLYSLAMMKYYESNGPIPTQLAFLTACVVGEGLLESASPITGIASGIESNPSVWPRTHLDTDQEKRMSKDEVKNRPTISAGSDIVGRDKIGGDKVGGDKIVNSTIGFDRGHSGMFDELESLLAANLKEKTEIQDLHEVLTDLKAQAEKSAAERSPSKIKRLLTGVVHYLDLAVLAVTQADKAQVLLERIKSLFHSN